MSDWLRGWYETLHIMVFDRDTYRHLRDISLSLDDDFIEVEEPWA